MSYKHGIYVSEKPTQTKKAINTIAGLQVIIGTAPINLADKPYEATNSPKIIYSFEQAQKAVGYCTDFEKYTLCQSISANFEIFNVAPIILINVLDPKIHKKENLATEYSIIKNQITIPISGILLDTVTVQNSDETEIYTKDKDYTLSFDKNGFVIVTVFDSLANETSVKISSTSIDPTAVTKYDIIGQHETNKETGLHLVRQIYPKFGLIPGLILAPGFSQNFDVAAEMQNKCEKINGVFSCETILDLDADTLEECAQIKEISRFNSSHAVVLWPKVSVDDKIYFYSAIFGALIAYTDANNSNVPNLSPSNKDLKISKTILNDGSEIYLDQEQGNILNSYGITTAINLNGFKSWGNNTAAYPEISEPKDRWFCCRRFFSWWANNFIQTYFEHVDNPANYRLIENICDSENIRGNSYVARGFCAGAKIEFLQTENSIDDILNGTIRFHQYLAPYSPAENIENILEFDPNMIEISGGNRNE